ncbi:MAG: ABC transporter permease [Cyanobacteria bacterium J06628_3]
MLKKMLNINSISIDEFLQRVGSQSNGNIWSVLVTSNLDNSELAEELKETISIFTESEVGIISANNEIDNIVNEIQSASEYYLIIWDFETWDNRNWRKFDQMRSRLIKQRGVVLVLSETIVEKMFIDAPNIVSWIGSRVYELKEDTELLTEAERDTRLIELQQWSGYSNNKIIELAESEQLPPDPEYGEWLVLLNREDLIGR